MKRWVNVLSQIVLGGGQIVNLATPLLSEKGKIGAAVALGAFSLIVSTIAHEFNTDGTPQTVPYQPK